MDVAKNPFVVTSSVFAAAQKQFERACEYANQLLQSGLHAVEQDVLSSASYIANLESDVKTLEALEHTCIVAYTRYQLATAIDQHSAFVEESHKRMQQVWEDYHGRIRVAAAALANVPISAAT